MARNDARPWTRRDTTLATLAALAAVIAYLPALAQSFTSDDFFILDRVKALGGLAHPLTYFTRGFFEYYRPLAFLSQALDWTLWGPHAFGFHLTNVLLHAVTSALVFALGRRLVDPNAACAGALLFALHPASHEAVYWIAARFDLLATLFLLASLLWLGRDGTRPYWLGVGSFALALLSKESALSLPVIALGSDVLLARRSGIDALRRLVPLLVVVGVYVLLRAQGVDVSLAGGGRRLPKLLMIVVAIASLLLLALVRQGRAILPTLASWRAVPAGAVAVGLAGTCLAALELPATQAVVREKLGFVAFAGFYLTSPIVLPPPPPWFLDQTTNIYALAGVAIVLVTILVALRSVRWLSSDPSALYLMVFVVAALIPVSSLTGGARYLYLASVGTSLFVAVLWRQPGVGRLVGNIVILVLAISMVQLALAARAWSWASSMSDDGLRLMTSDLEPCGTREVLLVTAPVGQKGTYSNFLWEAFGMTSDCAPATFRTLLRVVRTDVHVEIARPAPDVIEARVSHYTGNILASSDLSTFEIWVRPGASTSVTTPIGRLEIRPDGDAAVFRLTAPASLADARVYAYSDGRIAAVRGGG